MRRELVSLGVGCVLLLAGCNNTRLNILPNWKKDDVQSNKEVVTADALVDYLNKNSDRLKSLNCLDVRLVASKGITQMLSIQLDGKLSAQQPRDFRLMANMGGKTAVDLGSNGDEFWYWIRDPGASQSYQFFCSYKDLQAGNIKGNVPLPPFQPEWVMETLGMSNYGPATRYQLVDEGEKIKLVERTKSPQGQPVLKYIVFNRKPATGNTPQVAAFILVDATTKKEICSAQIQTVQLDPTNKAKYPEKMTLNWPAERMKLTMRLVNPTANTDVPQAAFVRQLLPGIPSVNLASGKIDAQPSSLTRAGFQN